MKRVAWSGALCAVAVVAAACGSGSSALTGDSAPQVLSAVKQALSSATSATITGTIRGGAGKSASFHLTTFSNGDFTGTIVENGASIKLVRIGNTDYLNATKNFCVSEGAPAQAAASISNKWVYGADSQVGLGNS